MNLFEIVFLDVILLVFPILIYLIYLSTNKNINDKTKEVYFSFALISSFFLTYKYGMNTYKIISLFILNSVIILSYLENKNILGLSMSILLIFIYMFNYSNVLILSFIYVFLYLTHLLRNKLKIEKIYLLQLNILITSIIYFFLIYKNHIYIDISNIILIFLSYFFITNIIYYLYETGSNILNIHLTFKELQNEKQIRLSLFKITHEIKNPIAVCKCYLDMMNTKNKNQVERYVPIIKSEIERLLSLLQDFLLINKNSLDLDIMDLNLLIEDTLHKLSPLLKEKNINLKLDMIDDEIFINGDYNRLSQVIINLIKNSIEAIPDDKMGNIKITVRMKDNKYHLTIEDNGVGMSREVQNRIKEPFFTTKKRGSGLGVSLSYEIMEAHNGTIEYKSEYGNGTSVELQFPIYQ